MSHRRGGGGGKAKKGKKGGGAGGGSAGAAAAALSDRQRNGSDATPTGGGDATTRGGDGAVASAGKASADAAADEGDDAEELMRPEEKVSMRRRVIPIQVTADRPLQVREAADVRSRIIGQLVTDQFATVIEERMGNDGDIRACVVFEEQIDADEAGRGSARSAACATACDRPRAARAARGRSTAG